MLMVPPVPESHDDLLEYARSGNREESPKQSEEFSASEEREKGYILPFPSAPAM